jgi:hypothetical protein
MSQFYDLSSLVVIPSGYKASTIYAQKPLTTDGQLSFSRASTATRVNSSGLIEAVASNVPRLDYLGSSCPRLLLEPQRTNSAQYSEQADNAYWLKFQATITANQATAPDGTTSAERLTTSGALAVIYRTGMTAGALSFFIKAETLSGGARFYIAVDGVGGASWSQNGVLFSVTGGTATNAVNYGNGWYRCNFNVTSGSIINFGLENAVSGNSAFIWGFQNEASATYATSYIPTLGASVTRVADAASKTGISSLIGQTEGVIFLDFVASAQNQDGAGYAALTIFGTSTDNIQLYNIGTTLYWYARNTAGLLIDQAANETLVAGQRYKIAYAYKSGDYVLYINGVQKRTYTGSAVPAVSQFNLCGTGFGAVSAGVKNEFSQMLLFKTRLTNAQLAELTTL